MRAPLLALAVLMAVSVSMTVVCAGYGAVNLGTMFPGPDDTPAQQAASVYHSDVTGWLMLGTGLSWLVTVGAAATTNAIWVMNRKRDRTEGVR